MKNHCYTCSAALYSQAELQLHVVGRGGGGGGVLPYMRYIGMLQFVVFTCCFCKFGIFIQLCFVEYKLHTKQIQISHEFILHKTSLTM